MRFSVRPMLAVLLAAGCGPSVLVPTENTQTTESTSGESSTTSGSPPDGNDESTTTTAADSTGAPPPPPTTAGSFVSDSDAGGAGYECDLFAQDCPPGEKCMPWANDGGSAWNATRCSPIAENPGDPGDPCMVEGSGVSGIDDCRLGAMCWDVDPKTNEGTCIAMCTGDGSNPVCEDPDTHCVISGDGAILPCVPNCDPLGQDCADNQGCYPRSDYWGCSPDASGDIGGYGDPCEFTNACDPGLVCLSATAVPDCAGSAGCCTDVCDLEAPLCPGAPKRLECVPWYDRGEAPLSYEDIGVCILP